MTSTKTRVTVSKKNHVRDNMMDLECAKYVFVPRSKEDAKALVLGASALTLFFAIATFINNAYFAKEGDAPLDYCHVLLAGATVASAAAIRDRIRDYYCSNIA